MWKLVFVSLTISIARLIVMTEASFFGDYDSSFQTIGFDGDDRRHQQASNFDNVGIQKIGSGLGSFGGGGSFDDYSSTRSGMQTFAAGSISHGGRRHGAGRSRGRGKSEDAKKKEDKSSKQEKSDKKTTFKDVKDDQDEIDSAIFDMQNPALFDLHEAKENRKQSNLLKKQKKTPNDSNKKND